MYLGKINPFSKDFELGTMTMIDRRTILTTELTNVALSPFDNNAKKTKAAMVRDFSQTFF